VSRTSGKRRAGRANWAYVLETGDVVMEGTGAKLLESEDVRKAYLGE
jgi:branched-chain amino acid transport system ATP-binding protein